MNIFLLVVVLVTASVRGDYDKPHHKDFKDMLNEIQKSDEYKHMPPNEKILLGELILAAEDGPDALNHFIHREGLATIFDFIKDLKEEHASHFEYYMSQHLSIGIQKRDKDLTGYLYDIHVMNELTNNIPKSDVTQLAQIIAAANQNQLTQYIEAHGYGPIFRILSHVEEDHNDELLNLITAHLDKEAAMMKNQAQ